MKFFAYLFTVTVLFASCAGDSSSTSDQPTKEVDASQLIPEHRYALEICECLGEENKSQLVELNEIIKEKGKDALNQDTTLREQYAPVGNAMTSCMNEIEKQFEADGIDPMGETFEENFYTGLKEQCPDMYDFMMAIRPEEQ